MQIWQETAKKLEKVYDRREAENISYLLLEDVFGVRKVDVLANDNKELDTEKLERLIERLHKNEPIQYVTGIADFFGRKFKIGSGALIPRPETEELCALVIKESRIANPKIIDVGTGSGCIAITLALELDGEVIGTDFSDDAIAIASTNAEKHGIKIHFVKNDVLTENLPAGGLDILVSNPPYIPMSERHMMRGNTNYEPSLALFVPDNDPILFYRRIAEAGKKSLKPGGKLYFELHEAFGSDVKTCIESLGYTNVEIFKDMQGKDRMLSAIN